MTQLVKTQDQEASKRDSFFKNIDLFAPLKTLTRDQKREVYMELCRRYGVDPLMRPFELLTFRGTEVLYATKSCTDQLRSRYEINFLDVSIDETPEGITAIVRAERATKGGGRRQDIEVGVVPLHPNLTREERANAKMKALTKAKRRVTLSLCGVSMLDESELDTMPGAEKIQLDVVDTDYTTEQQAAPKSKPVKVELNGTPVRFTIQEASQVPSVVSCKGFSQDKLAEYAQKGFIKIGDSLLNPEENTPNQLFSAVFVKWAKVLNSDFMDCLSAMESEFHDLPKEKQTPELRREMFTKMLNKVSEEFKRMRKEKAKSINGASR